ncbi:MAG: glycosyltransferase [Bacillota bacterium]
MPNINDYAAVVGESVINELYLLAERVQHRTVQNINSTAVGGGVAEILTRMIPLLRQLGVNARWDVIKGNDKFFNITKNIHNALHGAEVRVSKDDWEYLLEVNRENAAELNFSDDIMFIHDPQPIALIEEKQRGNRGKWIWRCHIDVANPRPEVMAFLKPYVERYDCAVFSAPAYCREMGIPQVLVSPSIDPLSDKNKDLPEETIGEVLRRFGIDRDRPVVTQISRFDYLKDPVGVIKVYQKVKKHVDCQLVLAGGGATDDPEGLKVLEEAKSAAAGDPDIHIIFLPPGSDIEVNALQRASTVVLQKSLKEGFGLTVSEALWKARPVIASAVGGIPLQIKHKHSGILTYSIDGTAHYLKQLLHEPKYAQNLGLNGKEHVKNNFLITRHIRDYLLLFLSLYYEGDVVRL